MLRSQKRLLLLLAALPILLVGASLIYMMGMSIFEGDARTFWESLSWAAETLSTTGYGSDTRWEHPAMVLFVIVLQFAGVFLVFLIFPIYLIPFLEERFETRLPTQVPPLEDHVVIVRSTPAISILLQELAAAEISTLIAEPDASEARRLIKEGHRVVYGAVDDQLLERVHLRHARTLVANSSDEDDAAVILAARELGFRGDVFALVEEPFHLRPMKLAGATDAFSPKSVLGAVLAARCSRKVNPAVAGVKSLGASLRIGEVRVEDESELAGRSLAEVDLGKRTSVTVIGLWGPQGLEAPVAPERTLEAGVVLVIVGSEASLGSLDQICEGTHVSPRQGHFVVAGHGEVGREVARFLREAGEDVVVVDREADADVEVRGNALDPKVLSRARLETAQAIVLALDTDAATVFAAVVVRDVAPHVPIFARVNEAANLHRIHTAGAQFAQALGDVSSHILAERMIGTTKLRLGSQLEIFRVGAAPFAGSHPARLQIRERSGCSVVAVDRAGEVFTRFGENFELRGTDEMTLCGSEEAAHRFRQEFLETD